MRVPSYRKHSSGQARVTFNGKDYLQGPYGSPASKEAYGRLIAEYGAKQLIKSLSVGCCHCMLRPALDSSGKVATMISVSDNQGKLLLG